jgi:MEMO1 family protein
MAIPTHPRVRVLELVPLANGETGMFALRDPYGIAGTVKLPAGAAVLVTLMTGERTLGELRQAFERKMGRSLTLDEVRQVVEQLDELYFLDNERFAAHEAALIDEYHSLATRPAAHAGGAYHLEEAALRRQLGELFTCDEGPGLLPWEGNTAHGDFADPDAGRLCGIMSPHIDFHRGGAAFAWAYDRLVAESDAELFVILGTAHTPLAGLYSVSQKDFATPLGTARTDRRFVDDLSRRLTSRTGAAEAQQVFQDELPHRQEHSIEFQALMLQYVLGGRRDYLIVPILVGSFHPFVAHSRFPDESPAVADFVAALRETVADCSKRVCYVAGVDMAHIGQQFGDADPLDKPRLKAQWTDDQQLLAHACAGDSTRWFEHVSQSGDRHRICGLAPMYTMLEAMRPGRGELLKYDQAIAPDGTSCVSFASVAFYE